MGVDIGSEMLFRHFGHLLRYCESYIRQAVPLALGLISVSNQQLNISSKQEFVNHACNVHPEAIENFEHII